MTGLPPRLIVCAAVFAVTPAAVSAHVLDQYLQASRIECGADGVDVELDLTPGIALAPAVFFSINTDRDGRISSTEGRAYSARVLSELVLDLDGQRVPLELVASVYPSFDEMGAGIGTIRLRATARFRLPSGVHHLRYSNGHRGDVGVYLVNAVRPSTAGITLGPPRRDPQQRTFELDVTVDATPMTASALPWEIVRWLPGCAALVVWALYVTARKRRSHDPVARL
jgi:nickel/cobalt transporter (NicO) family protein